jgi:hypothetical protein
MSSANVVHKHSYELGEALTPPIINGSCSCKEEKSLGLHPLVNTSTLRAILSAQKSPQEGIRRASSI